MDYQKLRMLGAKPKGKRKIDWTLVKLVNKHAFRASNGRERHKFLMKNFLNVVDIDTNNAALKLVWKK
ncbi:hypothetical protein [Bacillus sp. D386]|uniref:hypothetical protein n=1 Tax=Bacillus sp. D386 TaxID=2587155 RepID=UPI00112259A9|nr:hypothetical protein [Bacillus sp. D386]